MEQEEHYEVNFLKLKYYSASSVHLRPKNLQLILSLIIQ